MTVGAIALGGGAIGFCAFGFARRPRARRPGVGFLVLLPHALPLSPYTSLRHSGPPFGGATTAPDFDRPLRREALGWNFDPLPQRASSRLVPQDHATPCA